MEAKISGLFSVAGDEVRALALFIIMLADLFVAGSIAEHPVDNPASIWTSALMARSAFMWAGRRRPRIQRTLSLEGVPGGSPQSVR